MYELIILGFLMRSLSHGYRIAKIINDMIGPYAKISSGRLYPLFDKLEQKGFIEAVEGPSQERIQRHKTFQITELGRQRFYKLMMDTTSNLGDYRRIFGFKFAFLDFLTTDEQMHLIEHFIHVCQTHVYHIEHEIEDLKQRESTIPSDMSNSLNIMEHMKMQWELEMEWAHRMWEKIN
ncbi:PadR family transcriptional regulator [Alicyclobacillus sp. ALC3]|uniref:PadR family transcriptional regulator n=1 Tax=Alicyclobacillus sp. ALC3 TaxID=2796143 RepID=UPI002379FCDF|nr:PadR family transcriptional regulator [Alicyclobacillus sp. ALC3]WDL95329.1 helix-turn-helix transcriptional regulator [Alicyclobacillus sp. ALC3]